MPDGHEARDRESWEGVRGGGYISGIEDTAQLPNCSGRSPTSKLDPFKKGPGLCGLFVNQR